jgi:hypothetical protein
VLFRSLVTAAGCLSTKVRVRAGEAGGGAGVLVQVFADEEAAKERRTGATVTLVELFRLEEEKEVFLQRSLAGAWGVDELPPGSYRLRVVAVVDEAGNIRETHAGDRETDFRLREGQTAEVKIILKKTPTGLIVAASVTVIVLVVALAILLREHDITPALPALPPLPPPALLPGPLPAGVRVQPIVAAPDLWIVPAGDWSPPERRAPPRVTSFLPAPGTSVSGRRPTPTVTFSQPLDEEHVPRDAILMLGSLSGLLPGKAVVRRGLLRFEPGRDLLPGEIVTVTVRAAGVANPDGRHLEADFSWSFRMAD